MSDVISQEGIDWLKEHMRKEMMFWYEKGFKEGSDAAVSTLASKLYNPNTHILIAKEDVPDVPTKLPEAIVESGRVTLSRKTFAYYAKMRSLIVGKL